MSQCEWCWSMDQKHTDNQCKAHMRDEVARLRDERNAAIDALTERDATPKDSLDEVMTLDEARQLLAWIPPGDRVGVKP